MNKTNPKPLQKTDKRRTWCTNISYFGYLKQYSVLLSDRCQPAEATYCMTPTISHTEKAKLWRKEEDECFAGSQEREERMNSGAQVFTTVKLYCQIIVMVFRNHTIYNIV